MSIKLKALINKSTSQVGGSHNEVGDLRVDKVGRTITTPYQIRELLFTANATLTRGTETVLLAGNGVNYYDIVSITGANTSGIAQTISFRFGTGGAVIDKMSIPITSTARSEYTVPLSASEVDQSITAQNTTQADLSDSPVSITITGLKNI